MADYIGIYDEKTKEQKTRAIKKKLSVLLDNINVENRPELEMLLLEIAFCEVQLEELRAIISKDGPVARYDNGGGQSGITRSPAVTTYVSLTGTYLKLIKEFNTLLSKARGTRENESVENIMAFVRGDR